MRRFRRISPILTPRNLLFVVRILGGLGALTVAVLTLGPFQGLEQTIGLSDKAAHMLAFYGLAVMAFAVAPGRRATDLAVMVLAFGLAIEIVQGLTGRSANLGDFLADLTGVALASAPGMIERFRHHVRTNPYMSFSDIACEDRRRSRRRRRKIAVPAKLPEA